MEIRKKNYTYFNDAMKHIKHNIDKSKIINIYEQLEKHQISFDQFEKSFNISRFDREIRQTNILYENNKSKFKDHDEFALFVELNGLSSPKIDTNMSTHFVNEWSDALLIYELDFLSYAILQFFENECNKFIKLISIDGKYNINIFYSSKITSVNQLNKIIYHINNILNWIIKMGNAIVKEFKLDIILCPFKKTFKYEFNAEELLTYKWLSWTHHMKNDGIRPFNINTGLSYVHKNHIVLFRTDELFKVFIHECIHSLKYDFGNKKDCNNKNCEVVLKKDVNLNLGYTRNSNNYPLLANEAFTEYMAILCWNYYLASYYMYESKSESESESGSKNVYIKNKSELFYNMLTKELTNSGIMCHKLFKYYGITDLTILNKSNLIKQYTNAFSYVLIKYILLIHMVGILENKSADAINILLKKEFDNVQTYNYLLDLPVDSDNLLQLSFFHLSFAS